MRAKKTGKVFIMINNSFDLTDCPPLPPERVSGKPPGVLNHMLWIPLA